MQRKSECAGVLPAVPRFENFEMDLIKLISVSGSHVLKSRGLRCRAV